MSRDAKVIKTKKSNQKTGQEDEMVAFTKMVFAQMAKKTAHIEALTSRVQCLEKRLQIFDKMLQAYEKALKVLASGEELLECLSELCSIKEVFVKQDQELQLAENESNV